MYPTPVLHTCMHGESYTCTTHIMQGYPTPVLPTSSGYPTPVLHTCACMGYLSYTCTTHMHAHSGFWVQRKVSAAHLKPKPLNTLLVCGVVSGTWPACMFISDGAHPMDHQGGVDSSEDGYCQLLVLRCYLLADDGRHSRFSRDAWPFSRDAWPFSRDAWPFSRATILLGS